MQGIHFTTRFNYYRLTALLCTPSHHAQSWLHQNSLYRYYSTTNEPRKRDWRLAGHPAPLSLAEDAEGETLDLSEDEPPPRRRKRAPVEDTPEEWKRHRLAIKEAFPQGWSPPRKLSREAMDGLRAMHTYDKRTFSTPVLAEKFKISPEAVRRILRSKWEPSREQRTRFAERERRSREERKMQSRLEEKKQNMELISEAATPERPNRRDERPKGINSKDRLYFG
ncbi:hypothetical protein BDR03DRAFT_959012 [Suillus americanus]|nr:hypothetical protein BDR03DRAFT_959012 [Suillus americanus]